MATRDLLEYYTPVGAPQSFIRYRGTAGLGTAPDSPAWHIERYDYAAAPDGSWRLTDRQVMDSVPWATRATLNWAP